MLCDVLFCFRERGEGKKVNRVCGEPRQIMFTQKDKTEKLFERLIMAGSDRTSKKPSRAVKSDERSKNCLFTSSGCNKKKVGNGSGFDPSSHRTFSAPLSIKAGRAMPFPVSPHGSMLDEH